MNNVRINKPQITLGTNVQKATWHQGFVHPCITSFVRALLELQLQYYAYVRSVFKLSTPRHPNTHISITSVTKSSPINN